MKKLFFTLIAIFTFNVNISAQETEDRFYYDAMGYDAFLQNDHQTALKYFKKGAELGGQMSQYYLSIFYLDGNVVPKDVAKGLDLMKKVANTRFYAACYHLAMMYVNGYDVDVDLNQARFWSDFAIECGGLEDAQTLSDGIKFISSNLQKNTAESIFAVGMCYWNGLFGIGINIRQAIVHLTNSANRGYMGAQHNLGCLYGFDEYGVKNYAEAIKWYKKAAQAGSADSQYNLFIHYSKGIGVNVNLEEAWKWCQLAAKNGHPQAIEIVNEYNKKRSKYFQQ